MSDNPRRFYEFGPFRLDEGERRLLRDGVEVTLVVKGKVERLPPKALDLLVELVSRGGHMRRREELQEKLWPGTRYVEDNRLSDAVFKLRKFLGDEAQDSRYIETIHKHGYRFLGDVREVVEEDVAVFERTKTSVVYEEEEAADPAPPTGGAAPALVEAVGLPGALGLRGAESPGRRKESARRAWERLGAGAKTAVLLACAALAVAVAAGGYYRLRRPAAGGRRVASIAVLPCRNLGAAAGEGEDYLGVGMADAFITRLSNVRQFVVRPTGSVLKYARGAREPQEAGREQDVDAVLDCKVQRDGERIRVTAQLVRTLDGGPLWSGTFDEKFTDLFAVQDLISTRVSRALVPELTSEESGRLARRHTDDPAAHELYLKGRFFWNQRSAEGVGRAASFFEEAVRQDPEYALAYSGLADAYTLLPRRTLVRKEEAYPKAMTAARRAVALDPTLAEAQTSLAKITEMSRGDTAPNVERMYLRAVDLNPNYATARHWYAMFLVDAQRRHEEAETQLRRAREIDPLSMIINVALGRVLRLRGDLAGAAAVLEKAIAVDGNFPDARTELGTIYALAERYAEAVEQFLKAKELAGEEARLRVVDAVYLAQVYTLTGRAGESRAVFDELRTRLRDGQIQHTELIGEYEEMARMYLGRGKPDEAVAAARKAVELTGGQPMSEAYLARVYALTGNRAEARRILDRLEALHRRGAFPTVVVAGLHASLGDRDAAFEWLERVLAEGRCDPQCVEHHPDFEGLRSDPRYAALLSRGTAPPR